jgi:hypothetical protein
MAHLLTLLDPKNAPSLQSYICTLSTQNLALPCYFAVSRDALAECVGRTKIPFHTESFPSYLNAASDGAAMTC